MRCSVWDVGMGCRYGMSVWDVGMGCRYGIVSDLLFRKHWLQPNHSDLPTTLADTRIQEWQKQINEQRCGQDYRDGDQDNPLQSVVVQQSH
jgi:hypothetical protein